jgi:hypothetical protein
VRERRRRRSGAFTRAKKESIVFKTVYPCPCQSSDPILSNARRFPLHSPHPVHGKPNASLPSLSMLQSAHPYRSRSRDSRSAWKAMLCSTVAPRGTGEARIVRSTRSVPVAVGGAGGDDASVIVSSSSSVSDMPELLSSSDDITTASR